MKPYGLPRDPENDSYPDVATIRVYGLKKSKGGKDYFKGSRNAKNSARRFWKKRARRLAKWHLKGHLKNNLKKGLTKYF